MRKTILFNLLILTTVLFLSGCNAVSGLGRDISEAAEGTKDIFFEER